MAINILDDDLIKRNRDLLVQIEEQKSTDAIDLNDNIVLKENNRTSYDIAEQKENTTEIIKTEESKTSEYSIMYGGDPLKAIEDPKETIEINLDTSFKRNAGAVPPELQIPESKGDVSQVSSTNNNEEFEYNVVYENDFWKANNWFGEGRAKLHENSLGEKTVNINDLEIRENVGGSSTVLGVEISDNRMREMAIFLFMLFPYIGTSTVLNIRDAIDDPDLAGLAVSSSQNVYFLLQNLRYYTPFELGKYFIHNFYTMHFLKEMTIKYPPGRFSSGAPIAQRWDGKPNLFFGQGSSALAYLKDVHNLGNLFRKAPEDYDDGSQALTKFKDGGNLSAGRASWVEGSTMPMSPQIFLFGHSAYSFYKKEPSDMLGPTSKKEQEDYPFVVSIPVYESRAGKWFIPFGDGSREDLEGPQEYYNIQDRQFEYDERNYLINQTVKDFNDNSYAITGGRWRPISDDGTRREGGGTSSYDYDTVLQRRITDEEGTGEIYKNYILNKDVLNISFPDFKLIKTEGWADSGEEGIGKSSTVKDAMVQKDQNDKFQIGSILVTPIVSDEFESELPRFWIPFEFNPNIDEGDLSANYEATSVLSRIGEMQSFSNVGAFTVTLTTKYIATSSDEFQAESKGSSWMNEFTMKKIQAIESAYRSLVLPHHPDSTDTDQGYKYMKPPIIRVVMGSSNEDQPDGGPYSNLLTYQSDTVVENRLNSSGEIFGGNKRLRNFIATGLSIKKNLEESPLRLDVKGRLMDTFGFEVTLNLTEVTTSYIDALPDYKRYFSQYNAITGDTYLVNS